MRSYPSLWPMVMNCDHLTAGWLLKKLIVYHKSKVVSLPQTPRGFHPFLGVLSMSVKTIECRLRVFGVTSHVPLIKSMAQRL